MRNLLGTSETDRLARLAGLLYFLVLPTAGPWYYMSAALVGGDVVTLASLQAGRDTLVLAIVLGALGHLVQLLSAVVLYRLLSPFGKVAASLLLVLLAVSMPLSFAAMARETDLLALVDGAGGLSAFSAEQLQVQIAVTASSYTSFVNTAALFWGLWLFPLGWALFRCGFVPRVIGVLVMLGGPLYVMAFFGPLLVADYPSSLLASVVGYASGIPDLLGEIGTALWLLIMGARSGNKGTPATAPSAAAQPAAAPSAAALSG